MSHGPQEDSDPNDDDDQHAHSWQPNSPPRMPLSLLISKAHPIICTLVPCCHPQGKGLLLGHPHKGSVLFPHHT
jgi:hypothetical protein